MKLLDVVSADGFSVKNGFLACNLDNDFHGAYSWVHSRQKDGNTIVSTQALEVKNLLYTEYSSEDAYKRAVATYGGEHKNFLTPTAQEKVAHQEASPQPSPEASPQPSPKGEGEQTGGGEDNGDKPSL